MSFGDAQAPGSASRGGSFLQALSADALALPVVEGILASLQSGDLFLTLPSGKVIDHRGSRPGTRATLTLHRWRALRRLAIGGDIGWAEGHMDGDWSSRDLHALLQWAMQNELELESACAGSRVTRFLERLRHVLRKNSRRGSRRNIEAHYDLGNNFYADWLDAGMNYSSALYDTPAQSLEDAQISKLDRVIALLNLEPGAEVLEIGCGWGSLVERTVKAQACRVTGITLSQQQLTYARARLRNAGLADKATVRLQDYRDLRGRFDAIVSIEMLEAVGEAYWPLYFEKLRACLAPGGTAVLQVITIDDGRFAAYRSRPDFIQSYIFPGGMLPTTEILRAEVARAGLSLNSVELFGQSYARTLAEWRTRFLRTRPLPNSASWQAKRFRRMWDYYLAYCEVGFLTGALDVGLYQITHQADTKRP